MLYAPNQTEQGFNLKQRLSEIKEDAWKKFGWKPRRYEFMEEPFFRRTENETPSDSIVDLKQAIVKHISSKDLVLSPPAHLSPFQKQGAEIIAYDISPKELSALKQGITSYWCDIFHPSALFSLLEQVKPSVFYLSNIPEWACDGTNQLEELAVVLNQSKLLQKIMFASVIYTGGHINKLTGLLSGYGWEPEIFQKNRKGHKNVVVMSKAATYAKEPKPRPQ